MNKHHADLTVSMVFLVQLARLVKRNLLTIWVVGHEKSVKRRVKKLASTNLR